MRIVVDLPAPLGPSRPTQVPAGRSRSRPSTAVIGPKRLTTPRSRMARSLTSRHGASRAPAEAGGGHTILRRVVLAREHVVERQAFELSGEHPQAPEVGDDGDVAARAKLLLDLLADGRDAVEDVAQALAAGHGAAPVGAPQPELLVRL